MFWKRSCCKCLLQFKEGGGEGFVWREPFVGFYVIVGDKRLRRIVYCPFCGSKLPAIREDQRFVTPDEEEIRKLDQMMASVDSVHEVVELLGNADDLPKLDTSVHITDRHLTEISRYWRPWKTLCVDFGHDSETGEFGYSIIGKSDEMA